MLARPIQSPYPGLRPFEPHEGPIFFGREGQAHEILARLHERRFVMVLGPSGSGKSSLVRAGLLPMVLGGSLEESGQNWRIILLRPGLDPVRSLAAALIEGGLAGSELSADLRLASVEAQLRRSSLSLLTLLEEEGAKADERVLIIVDQFEELFRYSDDGTPERWEAADHFVRLLLSIDDVDLDDTYVLATMRAEFIGECARFDGLPDAVNRGQYLVPRLNREQRHLAVAGPAEVFGSTFTPKLVNELLTVGSQDADYLPVLQHALRRTWTVWASEPSGDPIDEDDYLAVGGMEDALARDAEEALLHLDDDEIPLVGRIFQTLTVVSPEGHAIRRPTRFGHICEIVEAEPHEVERALWPFRVDGRAFLLPSLDTTLDDDVVIDISHESLIRKWPRLSEWVAEEARSSEFYRRIVDAAERRRNRQGALLAGADLTLALRWWRERDPGPEWAAQFDGDWSEARRFLRRSRRSRSWRRFFLFLTPLLLIAGILGFVSYDRVRRAQEAKARAEAAVAMERARLKELEAAEAVKAQRRAEDREKAATALRSGRVALATGEGEEALAWFEQARELYELVGEPRGAIEASIAQARVLATNDSDGNEARSIVESALERLESVDAPELLGQAWEVVADIARAQGKNPEADRGLVNAASAFDEAAAHAEEGRVLEKRAVFSVGDTTKLRRYREANRAYKQANSVVGVQRTEEQIRQLTPWAYVVNLMTGESKLVPGYNDEIFIGRSDAGDNDFQIPNRAVSRKHVRMMNQPGLDGGPPTPIVSDFRSLNGTTVNGSLIGYGEDYLLSDGYTVGLAGVAAFQFFERRREVERPPDFHGVLLFPGGPRFVTEPTLDVHLDEAGNLVVGPGQVGLSMSYTPESECLCTTQTEDALLIALMKKGDYNFESFEIAKDTPVNLIGVPLLLIDPGRWPDPRSRPPQEAITPLQYIPFRSPAEGVTCCEP